MKSDHNNMKIVFKKDVIIIILRDSHFFKAGAIVNANDVPFQYLFPYLMNGYAELFQQAPKTDWIETVFYREASIKNLSTFGTLSKFKHIDTRLNCYYYIVKFDIVGLTVFEFNKKLVDLDKSMEAEIQDKELAISEKSKKRFLKNEKL